MEKSLFAAAVLAAASLSFASAVDLSVLKNDYFVLIEGGTFMSASAAANPDSYTIHEEKVDDFLIARYEVTVGLYEKVTGKNPTSSNDKERPVENISGYDCVNFCNALSRADELEECYFEKDGKWLCDFSKNGYRLPTLPEWEYAARGGKKSKNFRYSGSNNIDEVGWYDENAGGHAHKVGQKKPNELGLYDMSGNVGERCWDASYSGKNPAHVGRGGCWIYYEGYCEMSYRFVTTENYCGDGLGLRLVRSVK